MVHGGRTFSRRICALLKGLQSNRRIRLNKCFKADLQWWMQFALEFNGTASIIKHNYGEGPWFATDASAKGYGVFASGDWLAGYFEESQDVAPVICDFVNPWHKHWENVKTPLLGEEDTNINFWELVPVWIHFSVQYIL